MLLMVFAFVAFLNAETVVELSVFGALVAGFIGWYAIRNSRMHRRQGERRFRLGRPDLRPPASGRATYIGLALLFGALAAAVLTISELQKTQAMVYALILLGLAAASLIGIVHWGKRLLLSMFWGSFLLAGLATILWGVWRYRTADCFRSSAVIKTPATGMRHEARSDHRRISVPVNVPIEFQIEYNPRGGDGQGHISYRLTSLQTGRSQRRLLTLTPEERRAGAQFNYFGLINLSSPASDPHRRARLFVDDLVLRLGDLGVVSRFTTEDDVTSEDFVGLGQNRDGEGSGVDFGFSNSNHAGGEAGEIGGVFARSTRPAAYAAPYRIQNPAASDVPANMPPTYLDQFLGANGRLILQDENFDGAIAIGWFQADEASFVEPQQMLGLILLEPDREREPLIGLIQSLVLGSVLALSGLIIGIAMFAGGTSITDQGLQGPWGFVIWDQIRSWQLAERPGRTTLVVELPNGWQLEARVPSRHVDPLRDLLTESCADRESTA